MSVHVLAGGKLRDRLEQSAEQAGCTFDVAAEHSSRWTSATFVGGRHRLTAIVRGEARRAWLDALDEDAVYLPGFVLVQLEVGTIEDQGEQLLVRIEAITVKEA